MNHKFLCEKKNNVFSHSMKSAHLIDNYEVNVAMSQCDINVMFMVKCIDNG
jgi:hypothetical protein